MFTIWPICHGSGWTTRFWAERPEEKTCKKTMESRIAAVLALRLYLSRIGILVQYARQIVFIMFKG